MALVGSNLTMIQNNRSGTANRPAYIWMYRSGAGLTQVSNTTNIETIQDADGNHIDRAIQNVEEISTTEFEYKNNVIRPKDIFLVITNNTNGTISGVRFHKIATIIRLATGLYRMNLAAQTTTYHT